jgi:hypothetical protein
MFRQWVYSWECVVKKEDGLCIYLMRGTGNIIHRELVKCG